MRYRLVYRYSVMHLGVVHIFVACNIRESKLRVSPRKRRVESRDHYFVASAVCRKREINSSINH